MCTTGQLRCMAIALTRNGHIMHAASPAALPAGYGPANYHTAYNLPTTSSKNQTVAIVDAYDDASIYTELKNYSTTFGIPVPPKCTTSVTTSCFKKINMGAPAGSAVSTGWDVEIALDVETVHAICQNCKIVLVEAVNNQFSNLEAAETKAAAAAPIVSNSYGSYGQDGSEGATDDNFYNHPKKAIIVSAGDSGYGVSWPAALNTVVSVGGTTLKLTSGGAYKSEIAWGPDAFGDEWGTGSGCASHSVGAVAAEPAQAFQTAVANWAATKCGTNRGDNDVSANADPNTGSAVYVKSQGGFIVVGGTSLAAPLIAGVYALNGNETTTNYPASFLYSHAGTSSFRDVKSGSDDAGNWPIACPAASTQCVAKAGYDLPTGVGTPNGITGF